MNKKLTSLAMCAGLLVSTAVFAGGPNEGHQEGHGKGKDMGKGHMMKDMDKGMSGKLSNKGDGHMREVMGEGRIHKVMADRDMVNIKHEPMPEMNWPKMKMNFKVGKGVDLGSLKPGQMVDFTLLVDNDNNYIIKNINSK